MKREKIEYSVGDKIYWETVSGRLHEGVIKEIDSNVAYIDCEKCHKECCCEL